MSPQLVEVTATGRSGRNISGISFLNDFGSRTGHL
jgi:hypothetical protein